MWTAIDVTEASGPTDPAIPFQIVAGDDFTAIGWCAPVEGDERPPVSATGRLFVLDADGTATELPYARIEPGVPSALGELWAPAAHGTSTEAAWPVGRYVIELQTASQSWRRWLGLDLRSEPVGPRTSEGSSASPAAAPGDASSPAAAP